jgi:hypothetical protein
MTLAWWLFSGGTVGVLNGLGLGWTVSRLHPDTSSQGVVLTMVGMIARWSLTAGLLIAALQHGIMSGLLAFVGLWLARWSMVCWFNACSEGIASSPSDLVSSEG